MSKVFLKNKSLPSFEPIEQKGPTQKRKRTAAATLTDATSNGSSENQRAAKKSKAKKQYTATSITSSATITVACYVGATLIQEEDKETITAAFSIYFGLDDNRNCTEKVMLQKSQTIDHVYVMGILRALEASQDESSALEIYIGSKSLEAAIGQDDDNENYRQIKENIAKRKGSTSIRYKVEGSLANIEKDEVETAHVRAAKLSEAQDKMMTDNEEETLVDSLDVTTTATATTTTVTTVKTEDDVTKDDVTTEGKKKRVVTTTIEKEQETVVAPAPPTWAQTLNLRNLLDILKAPFYHKQK